MQQQAAAAGALQALMYCPGRLDIAAGVASEGGIDPLVHIVKTAPLPLRSAAAAALCNLALASPHNQVSCVPGLSESCSASLPCLLGHHALPDLPDVRNSLHNTLHNTLQDLPWSISKLCLICTVL